MNKPLVALATLAFLLTACSGGGGAQPISEYTGTNGITIAFDENAPPSQVYDHQPFFISLNLHNKGAHDVNQSTGQATVRLNTQNLFYIEERSDGDDTPNEQYVSLEGKSQTRPDGEDTSVSMGRFGIPERTRIGEIQDATETVQAQVCYPYQTTMSDTLCVKNPFNNEAQSPLCRAEQIKTYRGSGAPIAVTKVQSALIPTGQVEQVFERGELVFDDGRIVGTEQVEETQERIRQRAVVELTVANVGDGQPSIHEGEICEPGSGEQDNTVRLSAELGNTTLNCGRDESPTATITLDNTGRREVRCVNTAEQFTINTNYQAVLTAQANYTYTSTIAKDINIRQRPGLN